MAWTWYAAARQRILKGEINLETDTLKVALFGSASNAATLSLSTLADVTGQLSTANGYTSGGLTLANKAFQDGTGFTTFTSDDPQWSISGGSINPYFAVLYDDTHANDALLMVTGLNSTAGGFTVNSGGTLTLSLFDATTANISNGYFAFVTSTTGIG